MTLRTHFSHKIQTVKNLDAAVLVEGKTYSHLGVRWPPAEREVLGHRVLQANGSAQSQGDWRGAAAAHTEKLY